MLATKRPIVKKAARVSSGIRLTLKLQRGTSFGELEKLAPHLAVSYGSRDIKVVRDTDNASLAYLIIVASDPFAQGAISWPYIDGKPTSAWDPVPVGIDEDGNEVTVCLPERNLLIGGEPGSGKSVALSVILATLVKDPNCQLYLFDGKEVELRTWQPVASCFVGMDRNAGIAQLDALIETMEIRFELLGERGIRKLEKHHGESLMVIVIDELPFYVANSDTKAAKEFSSRLKDLISRGRAAGIVIIMTAQKPSADTVPSSIRDLVNLRLAFRCSTREASDTILGGGWYSQNYSATQIAISDRGVGLFLSESGIPVLIRVYWLRDEVIYAIVKAARLLRTYRTKRAEQ